MQGTGGALAATGLLGTGLLGKSSTAAFAADATLADIEAAAKAETQVVMYSTGGGWLTPSINEFQKRYPWATVSSFTGSPGQTQAKALAEIAGGAPTADVVQLGGGGRIGYLNADAFAPVNIPNQAALPAYFQDPIFHGQYQVIQVLCYNTNLIDSTPKDLFDLADPKFNGKIAFDRPQNLGASATFLAGRRALFGEDKWRKWLAGLQANNPLLTADAGSAYEAAKVGERAIAVNAYSDVAAQPPDVPVKAGFYDNLTVYPYWLGVTRAAKSPNLAVLLINFLQSMDGQRIMAESGRSPVLNSPDLPLSVASVVPPGNSLLDTKQLEDYWAHADEYLKVFNEYWPA
ncbi:MAG: extracellular solute-binding protein [Bauldia sp.]